MRHLIGKIITAANDYEVYLFRLQDIHFESGIELLVGYKFEEATEVMKMIWYESYDKLDGEFNQDMGLLLTKKQYNAINKCTPDTLEVE